MNQESGFYLDIFNQLDFKKIKDHPNILIAARFWDEERYQAAKICYRFMRGIDDFIDDYKAAHQLIREKEKKRFEEKVKDWLYSLEAGRVRDPLRKDLVKTMNHFKIPVWPMQMFAKSMIYDIHHDGFSTLDDFISYSQGATVAPSSIFVHLCGIRNIGGAYIEPSFDVKSMSTPCAVFSYLVHIIRDFQKDQNNNLNYFADELILKHDLTREDLKRIAKGEPISTGFRALIREYYLLADQYRIQTIDVIKRIFPLVEPRYRMSLQIIFNLYLMVFERIDIENGQFTSAELNPAPDEIRDRVYNTIKEFDPVLI